MATGHRGRPQLYHNFSSFRNQQIFGLVLYATSVWYVTLLDNGTPQRTVSRATDVEI
jgi:hypothetical protein